MTIGPYPGHRGTELPWMFAKRPVKPVALGLAVVMIGLTIYNVLGLGAFGDTLVASIVAVVAGASAVCLVAGWWARSQPMAEAGMLGAAFVLLARATFFLLTEGVATRSWVLSAGVAVIAGGSYLLEKVSDGEVRR